MKLKFLGTSFGAPSKNRRQQSILVEDSRGNAYLFDTGAPVLDALVNADYDPKKIKAIFISHLHGDHLNGIFDILNLTEYLCMDYTVYLPSKQGVCLLEEYCNQICGKIPSGVRFELISDGDFYSNENVKVTAIPTMHCVNSFSFMIESEEKNIIITGDLHPSLDDFPKVLAQTHTDLIVCECAHFSVADILSRLAECDVSQVAFVHIAPCDKYAELATATKNYKILLPNDNDEVLI